MAKMELDGKLTVHLKKPENKVLFETLAQFENISTSSYLANILENEVLPEKMKKLKENNNAE